MGLLLRSLAMLILLMCCSWLPDVVAQSTAKHSLDSLLQDYSFRGFGKRPKTGTPYDGPVPSDMTGIEVAALRLRSGSLRRKGFTNYKEFTIPKGVIVRPYVERLVLVYHNLGNWASGDPISILFSEVRPAPDGFAAKCVWLGEEGQINFSSVSSGKGCSTTKQGHFSIVVESISPAPPPKPIAPPGHRKKKETNSKVWIVVGSVVVGLAVMGILSLLALCAQKCKQRKEMERIEMAAEAGEALNMVSVGETRAPAATATRTQPVLENEYMV
ncbi:PREDICTED: uncharacterized protein LOC104806655 isoform X3 [Tarenaya hassleriana]|uniref:uncharacterized protein LOC104806655 isoform X3 n=1 Tax=Tarenaya hassleriana TaxID=28532 RepID=UPI00053C6F21|nr:PREDICTED: uncharacterized protein LOC104806655 isoform X3 [Tarenaya hassleriana]